MFSGQNKLLYAFTLYNTAEDTNYFFYLLFKVQKDDFKFIY